jgi:L-aminopeptidase/D-esterase-like protein
VQTFGDAKDIMIRPYSQNKDLFAGNTTISVTATYVFFTKSRATKMASMAHDGYSRAM